MLPLYQHSPLATVIYSFYFEQNSLTNDRRLKVGLLSVGRSILSTCSYTYHKCLQRGVDQPWDDEERQYIKLIQT